MNTQQDFELTTNEINELKRLLKSTIGDGYYFKDFLPLTDPKKIKQYLPKITQLSLEPHNNLVRLPASIQYLSNLEILALDYRFSKEKQHEQNFFYNLTVLSEHIEQLDKLHTLVIADNHIIRMPENIGELQQLKTLQLDCPNLAELPESIGQLRQLQKLILSFSPLSCGVFDGKLRTLPDSIGQLHNLRALEITNYPNLIFPQSFWQLNQLEELKISVSNSGRFLENIWQLTGLKTLEISGFPNITTLPENIGTLENLQTLYITSCQKLSSLPESLAYLKNLKRFYVASCENLSISQAIQKISCFAYYEDYWDLYALRTEEQMKEQKKQQKKTKTPKVKPILTREQKQAQKVLTQIKKDTATPIIKIKPKKAKKLPLTASKFGGVPYWDLQKPYPVDDNGNQLALLAQIDLAELPPLPDFPQKGLLQFFISNDDLAGMDFDNRLSQKGWRVVYHESVNPNITEKQVLDLAIPLENMPLGDTQYQLSFDLGSQSMGLADYRFEKLFKTTAEKLKIEFDEDDELLDLIEEETYDKLHNSTAGHHIGGYPIFTQDDPRYDENLTEHKILLLQIDSKNGIMWGDAGVGNFFITADDLKKRDFSQVLYNWDCA